MTTTTAALHAAAPGGNGSAPSIRRLVFESAATARSAIETEALFSGGDHRLWGIQALKNVGWVHAAVTRIATDLAGLPFKILRGPKKDDPEAPENNPLRALLEFPNPIMGFADLCEAIATYLYTAGSSPVLLETLTKDLKGPVAELWPIRPDRINPKLSKRDVIDHWEYQSGGKREEYPRDAIAFFSFFDPEMPIGGGLSPQSTIRLQLETAYRASLWDLRFFKKGARPSAVAETEQTLPQDNYERLQAEIKRNLEGAEKAWSVYLLDSGLKLKPWEANHSDIGFENIMRLIREEVLAVNDTPPAIAGDFKNANYAQVEMQERTYWQNVQVPLTRKVEGVVNRTIARRVAPTRDPRIPALWFRYDLSGVAALQEDQNQRVDRQTKLISFGLRTPNEVLKEDGRNAYKGGDEHYISAALVPVANRPAEPVPPNAPPPAPPPPPESEENADDEEAPEAPEEREEAKPAPITRKTRGILDEEPTDAKKRERFLRWRAFDSMLSGAERELEEHWALKLSALARYVMRRVRENPPEGPAPAAAAPPTRGRGRPRTRVQQLPLPSDSYLPDESDLIRELTEEHGRIYEALVQRFGEAAARAAAARIGAEIVFDGGTPEILFMVERDADRIGYAVKRLLDEIRDTLEAGLNDGETINDLAQRLRKYHLGPVRAERIARTEAIAAANSGTNEGLRQTGVEKTEWISSHDAFVRPSHEAADGQVRGLDEPFELRNPKTGVTSRLMFPGDPAGPAGEIINCRCTVGAVIEEEGEI